MFSWYFEVYFQIIYTFHKLFVKQNCFDKLFLFRKTNACLNSIWKHFVIIYIKSSTNLWFYLSLSAEITFYVFDFCKFALHKCSKSFWKSKKASQNDWKTGTFSKRNQEPEASWKSFCDGQILTVWFFHFLKTCNVKTIGIPK